MAAPLTCWCHFCDVCFPCARPDAKAALYTDSLKKGDLLLNRIQKLSKVVDME